MASESELKDMSKENDLLLSVQDLHTYFYTEEGTVKAVDGVSFDIKRDEILGLVGETGCGKSVSALSILKLIRYPGKILSGKIMFEGRDLVPLTEEQIRRIRGNDITMIFQDPLNSLNPVLKVGYQISEVYLLHQRDVLQRKLDYARTHNTENRIKLQKYTTLNDYYKKYEKKPIDVDEIFSVVFKNAKPISELQESLADNETYLAVQNARKEFETEIKEKIRDLHEQVNQIPLQDAELNFIISKIRIAPQKIRKLDMKILSREIKILIKELDPKAIIRIKEEQEEGELSDLEREQIIEELTRSREQLHELESSLKAFWNEMSQYDKLVKEADKEEERRTKLEHELDLFIHQSKLRTDLILRYMQVLDLDEPMINRFEKEFEELHHTTEEELFTRKKEVLLNEISNLNVIEKVTALLNEYQEITKLESSRQAIQEEIEEIRVEESQKVLEKKKGRAKIKYRKLRKEHEEVSRDFYDKYYEHEDVIGLKRIGFKVDEDDFQELEYVLEELKRQQTQLYREIDALKWDIKTEFEDVRKVDTSNFPPKVTEKINQLQQKVDSVRVNKQRKEVLYEQLKPLIQYREDIKSEIEELKVLVRKRIKLMDIALEESSKIVKAVGIADSRRILDRYPHELSGGMRQRIMISMGLACQSKLLICDEPTTALDVTIQAQILELIRGLKKRLHNSVLFITHNLGVIYELCDKVAVMYAGNIVEYGEKQSLFDNPMHPYTHGLLGAIPRVKPRDRHQKLAIIPGMVPNLIFPLPGCRFHPRCEHAMEICRKIRPELIKQPNGNSVACWLFEKDQDKYEPGSFKKLGDEFKEEIV